MPIYGVSDQSEQPYLVMPLVGTRGVRSLQDKIDAEAIAQLQDSVRRAEMSLKHASESLSTIDDPNQKSERSKRIDDLKAALRKSRLMLLQNTSQTETPPNQPDQADSPATNAPQSNGERAGN